MSKRTNRVAAAMARPVEVTAAMRLQERTKPVSRVASIGQVKDRRAPKLRKPEGPCKQRRRAMRLTIMETEWMRGQKRLARTAIIADDKSVRADGGELVMPSEQMVEGFLPESGGRIDAMPDPQADDPALD